MKYLLDTASLADITRFCDIFPIAGVTSNPSIVKKEGKINFFAHMNEIRSIIGPERPLHIQVTALDTEGMIRDADTLLTKIDADVYVKVPVTLEGIRAIKKLKAQNVHVTGTAIYSSQQGFLAMEAGADCIAPYFNRMENMGLNSEEIIAALAEMIQLYHYPTEILAASLKNAGQIDRAFLAGAHTATMDPSILEAALTQPHITNAVDAFDADWKCIFGEKTLADL